MDDGLSLVGDVGSILGVGEGIILCGRDDVRVPYGCDRRRCSLLGVQSFDEADDDVNVWTGTNALGWGVAVTD